MKDVEVLNSQRLGTRELRPLSLHKVFPLINPERMAILTDGDGTLFDSKPTNVRGFLAAVDRFYLDRAPADVVERAKIHIVDCHRLGQYAWFRRDLWAILRPYSSGLFGDEVEMDEALSAVRNQYVLDAVGRGEIVLFRQVLLFFQELASVGRPAALYSANGKALMEKMLTMMLGGEEEMNRLLPVRHYGRSLPGDLRSKPYPDGYELAAKDLRRKPEECVILEDEVEPIVHAVTAGFGGAVHFEVAQHDRLVRRELRERLNGLRCRVHVAHRFRQLHL
ncbi:MAG: hypothetical protein K1X83_07140 [Oligoflexia bacterium]|nr:hypothetical protein [Oligoflexia bacterium]